MWVGSQQGRVGIFVVGVRHNQVVSRGFEQLSVLGAGGHACLTGVCQLGAAEVGPEAKGCCFGQGKGIPFGGAVRQHL